MNSCHGPHEWIRHGSSACDDSGHRAPPVQVHRLPGRRLYLKQLVAYIHLKPLRARLVSDLINWPPIQCHKLRLKPAEFPDFSAYSAILGTAQKTHHYFFIERRKNVKKFFEKR
jgi:hypothetical protein